jgi:hypothetical protein
MQGRPYTVGQWRPHPGREAEFIAAWLELIEVFKQLDAPPGDGVLLRSLEDPRLFYSVGDWRQVTDIQAVRAHPGAQAGLAKLAGLCSEGGGGVCVAVASATSREA